jgi:uncharacterized protein (DUF2141 family)
MTFANFLPWMVLALIAEPPAILHVEVVGIKEIQGFIRVAVYDSQDAFMGEKVVASDGWKVVSNTLTGSIPLNRGKYAISIFHDVNSDGELNTNIFGIPKEPYGFSNNAKGKLGPPSFEKAAFEIEGDKHTLSITLINL